MFTGTALQDVVQKVISFRLPEWFEKGLIKYLANGWKYEDQLEFNKIWKRKNFKKTAGKYPEIAGQSFWNYLITTFGEQAISNWLYMTRIQKDVQDAARLVFSLSFQELQTEWYNFYNIQPEPESVFVTFKDDYYKLKLKPEETITGIHPPLTRALAIVRRNDKRDEPALMHVQDALLALRNRTLVPPRIRFGARRETQRATELESQRVSRTGKLLSKRKRAAGTLRASAHKRTRARS